MTHQNRLKPNYLVTMSNNKRSAEMWATAYHDALYFFNAVKYSSKVRRVTLHEIVRGSYCIRAAFDNPNYQYLDRDADVTDRQELSFASQAHELA
jgi:hypothetical protein